jgi:tyrosinase
MSNGTGIVVRPTIELADIDALRDAYAQMQALQSADNRSWIYWSEYHGFNRYDCWHYDQTGPPPGTEYTYSLFLPWHRAYLHNFDHQVRDFNPNAILPWWDWTSASSHQIGIPTAFADPNVNNQPNPLASGPTPPILHDPGGRTRRFPGDPADLPQWSAPAREPAPNQPLPAIDDLLNINTYEDFSSQLENVHDFIHGWVGGTDPNDPKTGGDMGIVATSAFDPIFYSHHAMIDRLWYLWQVRNGVNNIPPNYLAKPLSPWGLTVEGVLDVHALGYDYASSSASATPAGATPAGAAPASATPAAGGGGGQG